MSCAPLRRPRSPAYGPRWNGAVSSTGAFSVKLPSFSRSSFLWRLPGQRGREVLIRAGTQTAPRSSHCRQQEVAQPGAPGAPERASHDCAASCLPAGRPPPPRAPYGAVKGMAHLPGRGQVTRLSLKMRKVISKGVKFRSPHRSFKARLSVLFKSGADAGRPSQLPCQGRA